MKVNRLIFVCALFVTVPLLSQEITLTYKEAINIAVKENLAIRQEQNLLRVSTAEKHQSMANYLPSLSATGNATKTESRIWDNNSQSLINGTSEGYDYSLSGELTLFNGLSNYYSLKQSGHLHEARLNLKEQIIQDIIFLVSRQYLQILLDKELLEIAEKDLEVQQSLYDQLDAFVKAGTRTTTDLLTQKAQLKARQANSIEIKNRLQTAKANLAQTLLFEPEKSFKIVSPTWNADNTLILHYDIDTLLQTAIKERPDIKRLQSEQKAALQGVRISRAAYMPEVSFFYGYGSSYSPGDSLPDRIMPVTDQLFGGKYSLRYGLSLTIPIFDRLNNRTNVVRRMVDYENQKLAAKDFEMQLFLDVTREHRNFRSFREIYLANMTSAEAAEKSYQRQLDMYRLGQGSLVELNVENQRYLRAESEKIQAEYTFMFQKIVLDYYLGILSDD